MTIRNCFLAFLAAITSVAFAAERSCPAPPPWILVSSSEQGCAYSIPGSGEFIAADFIDFVDLLSRDASGLVKRVRFGAGEFQFNRPIQVFGSNGWLVHLLGKGSSSTTLVFSNSHGVNIEGPHAIGLIDKLTVNGNAMGGMQNDAQRDKAGILARRGANVRLGHDVIVEEFSRVGIQAFMSSTIYAAGVTSRNNGSDGFVASYNSTIYARNAIATGNRGDGFFSEASSSIDATGSSAMHNVIDRSNGQKRGGDGYVAILGGVINADNARVEGNEDQDFVALGQGIIFARGVISKANIKSQIRDNSMLLRR